jgi:hypothetical protein
MYNYILERKTVEILKIICEKTEKISKSNGSQYFHSKETYTESIQVYKM